MESLVLMVSVCYFVRNWQFCSKTIIPFTLIMAVDEGSSSSTSLTTLDIPVLLVLVILDVFFSNAVEHGFMCLLSVQVSPLWNIYPKIFSIHLFFFLKFLGCLYQFMSSSCILVTCLLSNVHFGYFCSSFS